VAAIVAVVIVAGAPSTVSAHTDFDYSVPTDGASVGDPVAEITVAFTEPVTLIGPGFEVLDPQGRVLTPFAVTDDDMVFRLQLEPPIGGGSTAVKYTVAAEDGHVLEGNITFTIAADEPLVTQPPTTVSATTVPATEPTADTTPSTSAPSTEPSVAPVAAAPGSTAPAVIAPSPTDGEPSDDGDEGSDTTLILLGLGAVVAAAFAFVLVRARMSG
jgi:copper transport protein